MIDRDRMNSDMQNLVVSDHMGMPVHIYGPWADSVYDSQVYGPMPQHRITQDDAEECNMIFAGLGSGDTDGNMNESRGEIPDDARAVPVAAYGALPSSEWYIAYESIPWAEPNRPAAHEAFPWSEEDAQDSGTGHTNADDDTGKAELLCKYIGVREDASELERGMCCIIDRTLELVCFMDDVFTAWQPGSYETEWDANAMTERVFVVPDASYAYMFGGAKQDELNDEFETVFM